MREAELHDAATANFVTHASWAATRLPGASVESTPALTLVDSGLGTDTFNLVCGARLRNEDVAAQAKRVLRVFGSVGRPFSWWIAPGDEPVDLASRLAKAGLEERETELAMALVLEPAGSARPEALEVEIREATSTADLAAFARINAENWDPPDPAVEAFYAAAASPLLGSGSPQRFFLASLGGKPVGALELTVAGGVGFRQSGLIRELKPTGS